MLSQHTEPRPAARWAITVLLAVLFTAMSSATQYASAQEAVDTTTTTAEPAVVEPAPAESAPTEPPAAETSADDEIIFDSAQDDETVKNPYEGPGNLLGRFVLAIMVVLIILAVVLMIYQKLSRRGIKLTGSDRPLRIVDKLALAPKQWVCLLNVCDRYLLLGVAEKEINVLTEVTLPGDSGTDENFERTLKMMGLSKDDTNAPETAS